MNPNNRSQGGDAVGPTSPQPQPTPTPQDPTSQDKQTAAANVLRTQIDALYGGQSLSVAPQPTTVQQTESQPLAQADSTNPYDRTHSQHPEPQAEQWKAYHTAWQDYYQKYYAAYYSQQQTTTPQASQPDAPHQSWQTEPTAADANQYEGRFFNNHPTPEGTEKISAADISKDEALYELRQKLLSKVRKRATKIRKSKHFIPVAAALAIVLIFSFLQYNRVLLASVNAYVSPGSIDPQHIVIDPSADAVVSSDPRLIIPKINVDVPVLYDIGFDSKSQMAAMEHGVAHFAIPGANSHPGEVGNTVLSGHSSNDLFDAGDYKFIFAQLEKLSIGDTLYANYQGKRYTYVVTKTEVVQPNNVNSLIYPTTKPVMTLITCTPLGTALNRLLVTAEQISPNPSEATAAPQGSGEAGSDEASIPGNAPTLIERLFGA